LPGNGAAELLTWACRDLAELAQTVLPVPAFGDYSRALVAFGATVARLSLLSDAAESVIIQPDLSDLQAVCSPHTSQPASQHWGLLFNNPHNPTGQLWSREAIAPYLETFGLVVVDEAFMDFLPPHQQQSLIDQVGKYSNLVILRSLTKFYSIPGLRLGYAIAHPDRLQRWQQWRDPWSVNALAAAITPVLLADTDFQQKTWAWLPEARSRLFAGFKDLPGLVPLPGAANFLLVQSRHSVTDLQRTLLQQHQILIRDCLSFPELGDRFFRVAVRTHADNQRLIHALQGI
jgi:histidinol-phosphate/aromatic aminotransferase/cobyric acid decarboxylase-like protein